MTQGGLQETAGGRGRIVGVMLAGGQSSRMGGGDKCLRELGGETILGRIKARVLPQVSELILNAGGDPSRFRGYVSPVVPDVIDGFQGPLAGILTGLEWTKTHRPDAHWVATFATDAPFLPLDLVRRMAEALEDAGADIACAMSGERTHPVFGLFPVALADDLRRAMIDEDMRKIDRWTARYKVVHVGFDTEPVDPFFNVNRPENLAEAERMLSQLEAVSA